MSNSLASFSDRPKRYQMGSTIAIRGLKPNNIPHLSEKGYN
ncbi:hypothetical protein QUB60_21385 [Microcoleus sp. A2-C5]